MRLAPLLAVTILALQPLAAPITAPAQAKPAPLAKLVEKIDIPYETFTLGNGLRVVVHTDRKAPIVSVGVWYHVGSRDEPVGEAGYAHLFEHLMFYGSEHNPGDHFGPLEELGASDFNGTTDFDRTNYFETVPTPALPRALFLESDRMGWLLPALDQKKLDAQRAVVLNEKYQGENQPYGLVRYAMLKALFPAGHPMHIAPIGLKSDIDKATLADVRGWFRTHYGPNNAVLVLAGDITPKEARPLVEEMFGDIPPGPVAERFKSWVPERKTATRERMSDAVATPNVSRYWVAPPQSSPESQNLEVALAVLASGRTSRLYQALVEKERLAVGVSGGLHSMETASVASLSVDAAPGVPTGKIEERLDQILADFAATGPTADEVDRVAMRVVAGTVRGLEKVGGFDGKGTALAEGMLFDGNPGQYKVDLERFAEATPATVRNAAQKWLGANAHTIVMMPGEREPKSIPLEEAPLTVLSPEGAPPPAQLVQGYDRSRGMPDVGAPTSVRLPKIERATLANGLQVVFARSDAVPVVRITLATQPGIAGDSREKPGLESMTLAMLDEGTNGRLGALDGTEIARRLERLGAHVSMNTSLDETSLSLNALSVNLGDSLAIFADILRAPTFPEDALARIRVRALTNLEEEAKSPGGLAYRYLPALIYGAQHPYGASFTGLGTKEGLTAVTRDDLVRFHQTMIRPDATLYVVGNTRLKDVVKLLNKAFGDWALPSAAPVAIPGNPTPAPAGITLIDRPDATQSLIVAAAALPLTGRDDTVPLGISNDILGGLASSRLFQELREKRHWSYGASSSTAATIGPMPFILSSSVDNQHTADAILAVRDLLAAYEGNTPATDAEIAQAKAASIRSLAGDLETGGALLRSMARNARLGRPDDYLVTLAPRITALPADAIRKVPLPAVRDLHWVIVGNRAIVEPQLRAAGLSWSVVSASVVPAPVSSPDR